ncbi:maleylacetoacetate isomerase [Pseudobacteriovorax antillogorgiicola]|uniref:Maleylacetoacetate isomerase/maleylpyruvate isomerase n=1 Tax=Pseudobacteriovorax antillogorgiicola TaxID=1513793 RepID=A0A1Y6BVM5_9BACT|nr:maleylacetoacetate isomerase [Pseudobacteriovorax antillogorgiicola]TCS53903.1 maleylacetoacetate isomerase/maleylpyruvate isomerase [Pseudobacteriovorax antillogorgiicola]SMF20734.1 maleylacetoacetate isomerase/maleylpyruvate isomerase [Pseudobacteriovorax antillogorgiicola]
MSQLTLYHYWRSSCSWRVRWALELKKIPYQSVAVNLLKNEQQDPVYTQKSPAGLVPCLEFGGQYLSESIAILEWLEERYPQMPLLPRNLWDRAKVRELVGLIASDTQPIQNLKVLKFRSSDQKERAVWAKHFISEGLVAYEKAIQKTVGTYSFGGQITFADLCLIPQVYNAHRFNVDMNQLPYCEAIYQRCLKLPSCDAAAPHNQPGAQP